MSVGLLDLDLVGPGRHQAVAAQEGCRRITGIRPAAGGDGAGGRQVEIGLEGQLRLGRLDGQDERLARIRAEEPSSGPHLLVARGTDGSGELIGQARAWLGVSVDRRLHRLQRHLTRPPQGCRPEIQIGLIEGGAVRRAGSVRNWRRHKAWMQGWSGQLAELAQRQIGRLGPLGVGAVRRAEPKAAVQQDAGANHHDQQHGDRAERDGRRLAEPSAHGADRVAQARPQRPPRLHPQPQLVLVAAAGPRRRERIVQLALERLKVEVLLVVTQWLVPRRRPRRAAPSELGDTASWPRPRCSS